MEIGAHALVQDGEDQHAACGLAIEDGMAADIDPAEATLHMIGAEPEPREGGEQRKGFRESSRVAVRSAPPERLLRPVIDRNQIGLARRDTR